MWENAPAFNAMIVFAEHRFYGQSQFTPGASGPSQEQFPFLTHEQVREMEANPRLLLIPPHPHRPWPTTPPCSTR